jgi:monothiol glutaredoxin
MDFPAAGPRLRVVSSPDDRRKQKNEMENANRQPPLPVRSAHVTVAMAKGQSAVGRGAGGARPAAGAGFRALRMQYTGALGHPSCEVVPVMDIFDTIREQLESNPVILYMKGSPEQPQCGFSARTVQALMACGRRFAYVDVLSNPEIRANLPKYADWPTFPQLWVRGELVGGCDIVTEMYESGELQKLIQEAVDA